MSYIVTHTNGKVYASLGEGVLDNKLGISLIGQNFHNYGQLMANNFLRLLENQASDAQPSDPIAGQIWWNTKTQVLSFFDGDKFKPCSSSAVSDTPPHKPLEGDQWFDVASEQLKLYSGTEWIVVGPTYSKGQSYSGLLPMNVSDTNSGTHLVMALKVDGTSIAMISNDPLFTLALPVDGITTVANGISLAPNTMLYGTSLNSTKLGNIASTDYVTRTAISNTLDGSLIVNGITGVQIGNLTLSSDVVNGSHVSSLTSMGNVFLSSGTTALKVGNDNTITSTVEPTANASITTKRYVDVLVANCSASSKSYTDAQFAASIEDSPIPTIRQLSAAINDDPYYFYNVNAALAFKANVNGSTFANLKISSTMLPTVDNQFDIGSPTFRIRNFYGVAVSSNYADLAENYLADAPHVSGTVMVFGGKEEVTTSDQYCDSRVAGVVSTNPAYLMNDQKTGIAVALTGKVPCKVTGPVKKGDVLVNSHFAGVATALKGSADWKPGCVIGKSLENNSEDGIRSVMISVGRF